MDITIDKFLELAQELCGAVVEMARNADRLLKQTGYQLTDRDRVLIGLAFKIESSFRSVMNHCSEGTSGTGVGIARPTARTADPDAHTVERQG